MTSIGRDDLLLYCTALLGIIMPALVFYIYSRIHAWFSRKGAVLWLLRDAPATVVEPQVTQATPVNDDDHQSKAPTEDTKSDAKPCVTILFASETGTAMAREPFAFVIHRISPCRWRPS